MWMSPWLCSRRLPRFLIPIYSEHDMHYLIVDLDGNQIGILTFRD